MEGQRALEAFAFDQLRTTCLAIAMPSFEMNCGGDLQIHSTGILKLRENTGDYSLIAHSETMVGSHSATACSESLEKLVDREQWNRAPLLPKRRASSGCSADLRRGAIPIAAEPRHSA